MDSYILDTVSGTFYSASGAVMVNLDNLSEEEIETFENGSDSDRRELGETYGTYVE